MGAASESNVFEKTSARRRLLGQRLGAGQETSAIGEIGENCNLRFRNSVARGEAFFSDKVDSDIVVDTGELDRRLLSGEPAMTVLDGGNTGKVQQGGQGFHVVLAVNDVRRHPNVRELTGDRDRGLMQGLGNLAEDGL